MSKKLKVLFLFDSPYAIPRGHDYKEEFKKDDWDVENDVYQALVECGYNISLLGLYDDIRPLLDEIKENRPDVVFNMTEVFKDKPHFDKNITWLLELLDIPYTGASPASQLICNDKALTKKILSFHRIKVANFRTFYRGNKVWFHKRLKLPVIVKPLSEEASRGISLASVVDNVDAFIERVRFIHENMKLDAIAEDYIEGRELYVSIIGNKKITVLPIREMKFGEFGDDEPRIATYKAKWDYDYREKWGIKNVFAGRLPNGLEKKIKETCKKAYRVLNMKGYARFDIRITPSGSIYIIEANANPSLERYDEIGEAAVKHGIPYHKLIQKIIRLAFTRDN